MISVIFFLIIFVFLWINLNVDGVMYIDVLGKLCIGKDLVLVLFDGCRIVCCLVFLVFLDVFGCKYVLLFMLI